MTLVVVLAICLLALPGEAICCAADLDSGHDEGSSECVCACHAPAGMASVPPQAACDLTFLRVAISCDAAADLLAVEIFQPPKIRS